MQPQPQQFWQVFWDIALWRRTPREVPASGSLFAFVAVVYTAIAVFQAWLAHGEDGAVLRGLLDLGLTLLVFFVALAIPRRTHRYLQTIIAVLGCGTLLSLPMIVLLLLGKAVPPQGPFAFLVSLASLPLLVWFLFVIGHIVRHALDSPLVTGMAVALTYFVVSYAALMHFLPPPAATVSVNEISGP